MNGVFLGGNRWGAVKGGGEKGRPIFYWGEEVREGSCERGSSFELV